jgi:putative DNA primase/helicase
MEAARVLQAFAALGVSVRLGTQGRIVYEPDRGIPEELKEHARACRAQLVALLTNGNAADAEDAPEPDPGGDVARHLSDLGNAKRLARLHGDNVRWVETWSAFYVWRGTRWEEDSTGQLARWAEDVPRVLYAEAANAPTLDERRAIVRWALQSEGHTRLRAMLDLLKHQPGIPACPADFDADPWSINVLNGTLDLRTFALHPHRREDLLTKLTACAYEPEATSEMWTRHLTENVKDTATIDTLQRFAGYSLTGSTAEERFLFGHGPTGGGKTTTLEALTATWGDYATTISFDTLLAHRRDPGAASDDVKALHGVRIATATETDGLRGWAAGTVKHLTGSDTLRARGLYEDSFTFKPQFKLWLAANARPRISASDAAFWARCLEVPFPVTRERGAPGCDPAVKAILTDPAQSGAAIFVWAVQGLKHWHEHGLVVSEAIKEATREYQASQDSVGRFLDACCRRSPTATATRKDLRAAYTQWCQENGLKPAVGEEWEKALEQHDIDLARTGEHRSRIWLGVELVKE